MTLTKTSAALIAAGILALGGGGTWLLTRPAGEPDLDIAAPAADAQLDTLAAAEPAPPDPVPAATATRAPAAERPAQTGRPASAPVARPGAAPPRAGGRVPDTKTGQPAQEVPPVQAPAARTATTPARTISTEPMFEELVVRAGTTLGLRIDTAVSSEDASVEDRVAAIVTGDLRVGDRVAIPSGATAFGEVTLVERGGKVKERARLGVRFTSIALGNGTRVPIETTVFLREGSSAAKESTAKIGGGAVGGAIIGGIIGGKKGAAIGSTVGAGAGTAAVMAGGRNAATLEGGEAIAVQLAKPATVSVTR